MKEEEFQKTLDDIQIVREKDLLEAIFLLDELGKKTFIEAQLREINAMRESIIFELKRKNLKAQTKLDTLKLINCLKNKKMDHAFMVIYNELKTRDDVQDYASEFQFFFNQNDFQARGFQTLLYEFLAFQKIDYDFIVNKRKINPKKLGNLADKSEIKKAQDHVLGFFEKDIAKYKTASKVFTGYLFTYWDEILFNNTINDEQAIINVTQVLLGDKNKDELNENERKIYEIFA
ncbi:hypothetical protein JN00_0458 [Metamycoplasma subdolum]|uniref:Uncharacterized protein n=1 Tax=Metamycoplasma subdolum TaxID=92407 RepID=A0A3L9ZYI3_9BACT|nr:hypothetical protein [Metamycoplasma subdolum]RMA77506.1 hypothetical protein JN00_0458 [Metamycoplasma subdolum]WPB50698.1 hypothetical protein R9C05_00905 [Metamycoplasma subdolum]